MGYGDRIAVFAGRHGQFVVDRDIVRDVPNIRVVTCFEVFLFLLFLPVQCGPVPFLVFGACAEPISVEVQSAPLLW